MNVRVKVKLGAHTTAARGGGVHRRPVDPLRLWWEGAINPTHGQCNIRITNYLPSQGFPRYSFTVHPESKKVKPTVQAGVQPRAHRFVVEDANHQTVVKIFNDLKVCFSHISLVPFEMQVLFLVFVSVYRQWSLQQRRTNRQRQPQTQHSHSSGSVNLCSPRTKHFP